MFRLLIVLLGAAMAQGAISSSPIQQVTCNFQVNAGACSTTGSVTTITISAPAAGNALILQYGSGSGTTTVVSTVTGGGVTWVKAKTCNTNRIAEVWYGLNSSGSGTSVVVTPTGAPTNMFMSVSEWSGLPLSGTVVDQSGCSTSAAGATQTTASITTTNAGDLIVACDRPNQNYVSGPTNSFVDMTHPPTTNQFFPSYFLPGATGTFSTSWTTASAAYDTAIVAFLPASSASNPFVIIVQ